MTQPSVEATQSGAAADAVRTLQSELRGDYSEMRSAEIQLTEAILSAHAVTVAGRAQLQDIQRQLIEAITNPVTALDTPAGERQFLMFLRSKIAEIQSVVDTGSLTDDDHANLTRALGSGYLLPAAQHDATSPQPGTTPDLASAIGSALGALPQAVQGAATAPAQGAGGLAGAASPLAGLASGLLERGGEPEPADRDDEPEPNSADRTDDDEPSDSATDTSDTEDDPKDRPAEPRTPSDLEPPKSGPAQTRPARLT